MMQETLWFFVVVALSVVLFNLLLFPLSFVVPSLIPTSGLCWYEACRARCYCWCLLVLLLFSKLHLWRTKPFSSNMNPAVCLSTGGGEDKAASVVYRWTGSRFALAAFQTSYRLFPFPLSLSLALSFPLSSSAPFICPSLPPDPLSFLHARLCFYSLFLSFLSFYVCLCVCVFVCLSDRQWVIYFVLIPRWGPSVWSTVSIKRPWNQYNLLDCPALPQSCVSVCVCVCACVCVCVIARFMMRITSIDLSMERKREREREREGWMDGGRERERERWGRDRQRIQQVSLSLYLNVNHLITGWG